MIKISIDGGGGFLKICGSVFDIDDSIPKMTGALSKKFLEYGVKKIFIRLIPDVSEDYLNLQRLWMNFGVEHLRNCTVASLKAV